MFDPPGGRPWLLYALLGCSLALNVVMVLDRDAPAQEDEAAAVTAEAEPAAEGEAGAEAPLTDAVVPAAQAASAADLHPQPRKVRRQRAPPVHSRLAPPVTKLTKRAPPVHCRVARRR
jgi:hypothetical protein